MTTDMTPENVATVTLNLREGWLAVDPVWLADLIDAHAALVAELEAGLLATCQRETATIVRWENKLAASEARVEKLRDALDDMVQSVCGPVGFAEAVRHISGFAYPWPSLDAAEAKARAALHEKSPDEGRTE
jgi:hypothetical protein